MKYKLLILLLFIAFSLPAQQPASVRNLEKERLATLAEIKATNQLLNENQRTTSNALSRLSLISQQIIARKKVISLLNSEIVSLDNEIVFKELQIKTLEKNLKTKKEDFAQSIRKMYSHKNRQDNLLFILSAQNFTQSFHRVRYLKEYSNWRKQQAIEISEKQNQINLEKSDLEKDKSEKIALLQERQTEEASLSREESTKKAEVKSLEKNKKKLQAELTNKQRQANALNQQIEKIIAEEVAKSEKAAQAATTEGGEKRVAEVKGGYAMTPAEKTLSSNFANNKGKLPFPLKGNYKITGKFGAYQHEEVSMIRMNNNGIEIETTPGNEAKAVFEGVVTRIFTIPGLKNSIIIRHGNYLTLYSNIDEVYVKQGNKVTTGQSLGKIFTDREKGNTLLHFEVWKEKTKLDPLLWLSK
ncbi:peptidase [Bacteroidia bacterium]|nr:peptidase [Bacteroidia bacterium]